MPERTTEDLCQDCWQTQTPDQYAPVAHRYGICAHCKREALVVRTAKLPMEPCPQCGAMGWVFPCSECGYAPLLQSELA